MKKRMIGLVKVTRIRSTKATVHWYPDGKKVLFSYGTPQAVCFPGGLCIRTECYFSVTTSRHTNEWCDGAGAEVVPHSRILDSV